MQKFESKKFFDAILSYREKHDMTIREMAKKAKLPQSTLQRMEAGRLPSVGQLCLICSLINVPAAGFFSSLKPKTIKSKTSKK